MGDESTRWADLAARDAGPCPLPQACAVVVGPSERRLVLVVEDDAEDRERLVWAFEECTNDVDLRFAGSAAEAADYLFQRGAFVDIAEERRPSLVLLEAEVDRGAGRELIRSMRASRRLRATPILVCSRCSDPSAVQACYQLGANSYFSKPDSLEGFRALIRILETYWLRRASLPA